MRKRMETAHNKQKKLCWQEEENDKEPQKLTVTEFLRQWSSYPRFQSTGRTSYVKHY